MVFGNPVVSVLLSCQNFVLPIVVLSSSVFSSFADAQNYITSKLLVRLGCISNRWKVGRAIQLFCIQLREESHSNSLRFNFSLITAVYPELQFSANPPPCKKL
jgi:hypothetical protein